MNIHFDVFLGGSVENTSINKCKYAENITEDCTDNPTDNVTDNTVTVETLPDLASLFVTPATVMPPKEKGMLALILWLALIDQEKRLTDTRVLT